MHNSSLTDLVCEVHGLDTPLPVGRLSTTALNLNATKFVILTVINGFVRGLIVIL